MKFSDRLNTVFDDDESFVDLHGEDKGTLTITIDERFSGTAALVVELPQRYVSEISSWKFCIRENPGLDEFRYLRFAWRLPRGQGILIELGDRTPLFEPARRYDSGENTAPWEATEVAAQVPRQWIVVTRDLWEACIEFTLTGMALTWEATEVAAQVPRQWIVVTRDLWEDCIEFTLTGMALTAMGGEAMFDRIELLRTRE